MNEEQLGRHTMQCFGCATYHIHVTGQTPQPPPFPSHPPTPMQQERTWKNAKKLQKPPEKGFFMFSWGYRGCWDVFGTGCTPSAWAMRVWSHTFPIHTCITLWVFFQSFFSKHRWLIACIGISNSIN